jgi:uncharacterized protein YjbI with pentapeptide repeats
MHMDGANLSGAQLNSGVVTVHLKRADFPTSNLETCSEYLMAADLSGAHFRKANFAKANLAGANFRP